MFEVEPNLWLQGYASPLLTSLMKLVSMFGYDWIYATAVIGLGFGWRLRPMLGVMLALLLASSCTHAVKDSLQLPRPVQVDARVLDKGHINHRWQVERGGAKSAFGLPSDEAVEAQRHAKAPDYGFLSGHVASATALCVSFLLWCPRRKWIRVALIMWPLVMAVSRMYLGRHFLADVVFGAICGALCAALAKWLWSQKSRSWLIVTAGAVAAASLIWQPLLRAPGGQLLGLAITFLTLHLLGWPEPYRRWWGRVISVLLAFAIYALCKYVIGWVGESTSALSVPITAMLTGTLATMTVFIGTYLLCKRAGLYQQPSELRSGAVLHS